MEQLFSWTWLTLVATHLVFQGTIGVQGRKAFVQSQNGCATKHADITMGSNICDSCRKKLAKLSDLDTLTESPTPCGSPTDEKYLDAPEAVATVNRCLLEIGETPLPPATKDIK